MAKMLKIDEREKLDTVLAALEEYAISIMREALGDEPTTIPRQEARRRLLDALQNVDE